MATIGSGVLGGCQRFGSDSNRTLIGVFPGEGDAPETVRTLGRLEEWLSMRPAVVTVFTGSDITAETTQVSTLEAMTAIWERGQIPLLTWEPFITLNAESVNRPLERQFYEGEHDELLDRWAQLLEDWTMGGTKERRFYFRPVPEMNGDWYPWATVHADATPEDYVRMWRHFHNRLSETALTTTHVQWLWSPNHVDTGEYAAEEYYPGDDYVDWVGVDGYNWGSSQSWSTWQSPVDVFESMVKRVQTMTDKPLSVPEFGSTSAVGGGFDPERKAEWITDAFAFFATENVRMGNWFNIDKETDWAVFDGVHGTTVTTIDGNEVPVYESYYDAVTASGSKSVAAIEPDAERVLTDAQFAGTW